MRAVTAVERSVRQHLRPTAKWLEPRYLELGDNPAPRSSTDKAAPPWASGNTNSRDGYLPTSPSQLDSCTSPTKAR